MKRLITTIGIAISATFAILALPVLLMAPTVASIANSVIQPNWLIASTLAQTLTLTELTTEVGTLTTTNIPSLATFVAFFVIVAATGFLVGKLLRAGKA